MGKLSVGFVGAGNMATAIMGGIVGKGILSPAGIGVIDLSPEKMRRCREEGFAVFEDIPSLVEECGVILLCVKPQSFPEVLPEIRRRMSPEKVLVSIAAGITAKTIQDGVGFACKLVLVMPNTPLLLGEGASALSRIEPTTPEEFDFVFRLFSAAGTAAEIQPSRMNEIIPVNGSSPAFLYQMAKVIVEEAERRGISPEVANRLFCQTLTGSAKMMLESGKTHQELIDMVCSPGGTTLAAMRALEEGGFSRALQSGFDACVNRAKELSGNL